MVSVNCKSNCAAFRGNTKSYPSWRFVTPLRQECKEPAGRIRRHLQPEEHETYFRFVETAVRLGEAFPSLGKISRGEMVLSLFDQVPCANLGGPLPYQFPLCRAQRQILVSFIEDHPVRLHHLGARRAERPRTSVGQACLYLPVVPDFAAIKRGAQPHVVVVATGQAFVEP